MRTALLVSHIAFGTIGLAVGPLAMRAPKRQGTHTRLGVMYQVVAFGLCSTALGLVVFHPAVWPLALIAVATELAALAGWRVRRRRRPGWLPIHIGLMCGSYVSCVTAFLVVNLQGSMIPWVLPTLIATPLITRAANQARAMDRAQLDLARANPDLIRHDRYDVGPAG